MNEIAQNISVEHKRFVAECVNARDAGCKLYILVENDEGISDIEQVHTWINPQCIYHPKCIQGGRLEKAMKTIQMRYGCTFLFVSRKNRLLLLQRYYIEVSKKMEYPSMYHAATEYIKLGLAVFPLNKKGRGQNEKTGAKTLLQMRQS